MKVDLLAVGAHPDDLELGVGGLLHKLCARGLSVAIVDLTRGELGTRGTPELRAEEAAAAARVLGIAHRENAGIPDGGVANTTEQQRLLIPFIRKYRPAVLLGPMTPDRHPDHAAAHGVVKDGNYFSGLAKIDTGQAPYRVPRVYHYHPYGEESPPPLVVDITDHMAAKLEALRAYGSQFHNPEFSGGETMIASKSFWDSIEARARYWGSRIGCLYGEALYTDGPAGLDLPPGLG